MEMNFFQKILVIIFRKLFLIPLKFDSEQVKRDLISSLINYFMSLLYELSRDLRLRILGNYEMIGKF